MREGNGNFFGLKFNSLSKQLTNKTNQNITPTLYQNGILSIWYFIQADQILHKDTLHSTCI
jgi:hypothetical protein